MNAHVQPADLETRLRAIGDERYHDKHPFHHKLHSGQCSPDQVRAWVINRWAYQAAIPMKDAAFLSRCSDPQMRREWRSRIEDHDGGVETGGGIRRWLKLAEAEGMARNIVGVHRARAEYDVLMGDLESAERQLRQAQEKLPAGAPQRQIVTERLAEITSRLHARANS